ncbi:SDR family oxidoreductase [Pediococcus argentinicus]|uniref:SDR family NAD(P)-dependent oxidoreductase n=1 Tax=Pediococcus argentinicus TaxID=480391 RepID=UPI00338F54DF
MKKVIVITGGTSGIGLATAREFAADSNNQVIVIGRNPEKTQRVSDDYPELIPMIADLSKVSEVKRVFEEIKNQYKKIDVLFANAGFGIFKQFNEITEDDFDRSVSLNYKGIFFSIQEAVSLMPKSSSIIINVSWTYHRALTGASAYSSSKAALSYLPKVLALELADKGIRVNAVSPGYVITEQFNEDQYDKDRMNHKLEGIPAKRFAKAKEIGTVVKFLASDDASYVNGQEIVIDGGLTAVQNNGD